jgi:tRNA U34 5-carboxymethylaminomethyl modifying GTPase MnmE/TrmE
VEGLADLIGAETEAQRRQAFRQMKGLLGDKAESWRAQIIQALALVEAGIDFSDEGDVPEDLVRPALDMAHILRSEISEVLAQAGRGERLRDGMVVAIAGPPNAGKSTLLNRIARREAAIVSPYAGTTRDVIEVHLDLGGYPVTLLDTAGLRETDDPVEQEGVRRARARAAEADLILWVTDARERVGDEVGQWPSSMTEAGRSPAEKNGPSVEGDRPTLQAIDPESGAARAPADRQPTERLGPVFAQPSRPLADPRVWIIRNKADLAGSGSTLSSPRPSASPSPGDSVGNRLASTSSSPRPLPTARSVDNGLASPPSSPRRSPITAPHHSVGGGSASASSPRHPTPSRDHPAAAINESEFINGQEFTVSALLGDGVDELLKHLDIRAAEFFGQEQGLIARERHRAALRSAQTALARALASPSREEILAEELRLASRALGRLTGKVDVEDILDVIFRDFCIGK